MSKPHRILAILSLAAALVMALVAASGAIRVPSTALGAAAKPGAAAKLAPPRIHEIFTPLPCNGRAGHRNTLQQLGCAEQSILRTDRQLGSVANDLFSRLPDGPARRRFVLGVRAWLSYRNADCASRSDVFEGGTRAPVLAAQCMAARDKTRLSDLRAFASALNR
jgi:uncharacterized protein YecT (DUF1311 family)